MWKFEITPLTDWCSGRGREPEPTNKGTLGKAEFGGGAARQACDVAQKRTDERKACKTCAGEEHSDGGRTLRRHPDEGAFTRGDGRTDWCNHRRSSLWGRVNPEFGGGAIVKTPQVVNGGAQCGGVTERNDAGEGEIEHPQRLSQQPGYI